MARHYDSFYSTFLGRDFTEEFWRDFARHVDERLNKMEILEDAKVEEIERLEGIAYEQISVLFADAAASLNAFATLGRLASVRSVTSASIEQGEITLIIDAADRSNVPSNAFISAAPQGVDDTWMTGFMTYWSVETGELRFSATASLGSGSYSDWIVGLAVSGGSAEPTTVPQVTVDYIAAEFVAKLAPILVSISALEAVPPPDLTLGLAYTAYRSAG